MPRFETAATEVSPADWASLVISCFSLLVAAGAFFWAIKRPVWVGRWEDLGSGVHRFTIRNIGEGTARFARLSMHAQRRGGVPKRGLDIEADVLPGESHQYEFGYGTFSHDVGRTFGILMFAVDAPAKVWAEIEWHEAPFTRWKRRKKFLFDSRV